MNSTPSASFTIDFYSSAANDDNNLGQSEKYLGSQTVTTITATPEEFVLTAELPGVERKLMLAFSFDTSGDVRIPDPW